MSTTSQPPPPEPPRTLEWAKQYVAAMSEEQRAVLQQMYDMEQERLKKEKEQKAEELAKQQQQAILDSLTRQIPITVDVVRASTPPESHASSSRSSQVEESLEEEEEQLTVKDVVYSKFKSTLPSTSNDLVRPYRPRSPRERVFFDNHIYIFDKTSFDHKKKFYRCEKKNTCHARVHTPRDSSKVIHKIQNHNHEPPPASLLEHFGLKPEEMRSGFIYPLRYRDSSSPYPTSMLTPKSDIDEEETTSPMDILNRMVENIQGDRKPAKIALPDNFSELSEPELHRIDLSITKFLLMNREICDEFMRKRNALPTFFPEAKKDELVLFVADYCKQDGEFHMVKVEERNEKSIRTAIERHLNLECSKSLMMNISSRINIPLSQQMINEWKTEEFIRLDSSKANSWKIHHVTRIDQ